MPLRIIDAYHTSKWCSRFGAVGYGHSTNNYSLFLCRVCGLIVDSGRKSSLAVCVRAFLGRIGLCSNQPCFSFQVSRNQVLVSGLFGLGAAGGKSVNVLVVGEGEAHDFSHG
jgi:hypothetical protein